MSQVKYFATVPTRVTVDPNSIARSDPRLSVVSFDDLEGNVYPEDEVLAVQPDDDGYEGVAPGRVERVDFVHKLVYVEVDWDQFTVVPSATAKYGVAIGFPMILGANMLGTNMGSFHRSVVRTVDETPSVTSGGTGSRKRTVSHR